MDNGLADLSWTRPNLNLTQTRINGSGVAQYGSMPVGALIVFGIRTRIVE